MTEPSWAVAIIEPNRDFEADRALRRSGFRVVFLTYRKLLTGHNRPGWRKATDRILVPILSGYMFVQLWPGESWPTAERAPGFLGFIGGREPVKLADDVVRDWLGRVNDGCFDDEPPPGRADRKAKFQPANSPEERRALLAERFREMLGAQDAA